ncbi:Thioredoxin [bioreactor metagenome]
MQAPILEQLQEEYDEDEFRIVKMDVDENPETPQQFGIMSIPTLLLKKDGQVVEKAVGVHSKEQLRQMVDQYL